MKVKRSFPLTSVETVEYDEINDPTKFQLIFSNCIEILQAETTEEASDWVEKIVEGFISESIYENYCQTSFFLSRQHVLSGTLHHQWRSLTVRAVKLLSQTKKK